MDNFNPNDIFSKAASSDLVRPASEIHNDRLRVLAKAGKLNGAQKLEYALLDNKDELVAAEEEEEAEKEAEKEAIQRGVASDIIPVNSIDKPEIPQIQKRIRVTFEIEGGYYTIPAIDVKVCKYGAMVLMPAGLTDATFAPSPGSDVILHWDDKQIKCFSPGIMFELDEMKCLGVVLIKAGE